MNKKKPIAELEARRLAIQDALDAEKDAAQRNRMGQFATPTALAVNILRYAKRHFGKTEKILFIDPAIGTGSFYSALLDVFPKNRIEAHLPDRILGPARLHAPGGEPPG